MDERTLYLISGPAGVGKSTIAQALAKTMDNGAYVSGDTLHDFHIKGAKPPWESEQERRLIWENIRSVSLNFLSECDVVVDYVAFMDDAHFLRKSLPEGTLMKYVVLDATEDALVKRDALRAEENRMKARTLILKREFQEDDPKGAYRLSTGGTPMLDPDAVIATILDETRYDFENDD